ncbi:MAG: hypothetical protein QOG64_516, partial [Acidimicrobiaceae bacterium]|nr:hypothetical protein [Acidimicrobiaceae bacterium]
TSGASISGLIAVVIVMVISATGGKSRHESVTAVGAGANAPSSDLHRAPDGSAATTESTLVAPATGPGQPGPASGPPAGSTNPGTTPSTTAGKAPPGPPSSTPSSASPDGISGASGRVMVGPTCPVQQAGQSCEKPASNVEVRATAHGGSAPVANTTTGADGSYQLALAPGTYDLSANAGMSCRPITITVESGRISHADVTCDTGIR